MCMKVPLGMRRAIRWALMESHRVREEALEEIVVTRGDALQNIRKRSPFTICKFRETAEMSLGEQQRFERPHSPEWHHDHEIVVLADDAFSQPSLEPSIIAQETTRVFVAIVLKRTLLFSGFIWNSSIGPDLAVRVGIAASHQRATVLKDLHVIDISAGTDLTVLLRPDINHFPNIRRIHLRDRQIMARREAHHSTHATLRFRNDDALPGFIHLDFGHIWS